MSEDEVTVLLESMIPRRMVKADTLALETGVKGLGKVEAKPGNTKEVSVKKYRLFPFLVGWYESYLQEVKPESANFARNYSSNMLSKVAVKKSLHPDPAHRAPYLIVAR